MASRGRGARNKGANYERKLARIFSERFGIAVKRTPAQESAKIHGGDFNAHKSEDTILNDFFWEAKCRESWAILDWYKKAVDDCGGMYQIPIVVASKNNEKDYVFLSLDDFIRILVELDGFRKAED